MRTASDLSFHTLREYVPGDDRRFIHWKSSARNGTLQVREFVQTHRSLVAVVLSGSRADYHWADDGAVPAGDAKADDEGRRTRLRTGAGRPTRTRRPTDDDRPVPAAATRSSRSPSAARRRSSPSWSATIGTSSPTPPAPTIRAVSADGVLDQFCADRRRRRTSPDLISKTRRVARRHPRASLLVLVFGSAVGAAQLRAAARACPAGATVLAVRARVGFLAAPRAAHRLADGAACRPSRTSTPCPGRPADRRAARGRQRGSSSGAGAVSRRERGADERAGPRAGRARSPRRRPFWRLADLAVLAALVVLGSLLLVPAYGSAAPVVAAAVGAALVLGLVFAVRLRLLVGAGRGSGIPPGVVVLGCLAGRAAGPDLRPVAVLDGDGRGGPRRRSTVGGTC